MNAVLLVLAIALAVLDIAGLFVFNVRDALNARTGAGLSVAAAWAIAVGQSVAVLTPTTSDAAVTGR